MMDYIKELLESRVTQIILFAVAAYIIGYGLGKLFSHIQHSL